MPEFDATKKFPLKEFTRLPSETAPTYADIRLLNRQMNSCTQAIKNDTCPHGYAVLSFTTEAYTVKSGGIGYVVPLHPGNIPPNTAGMTGALATETIRLYLNEIKIYEKYQDVEDCLKQLLIAAVPPEYLAALNDEDSDLVDVSCKTIITHLWEQFGEISQAELKANIKKMESQWAPETPIAALFARIDDCRRFAEAGNDSITDKATVRAAYDIVEATGRFTEPCRAWRMLPTAQITWANFKLTFAKAHKDLSTTSQTAGYHSANAVATPEFLALTKRVGELEAALKIALAQNSAPNKKRKEPPAHTATSSYCWTHGHLVNPKHTSESCTGRKEGHQETATATNMMGGNPAIWKRAKTDG
jgi:hypothetical protein